MELFSARDLLKDAKAGLSSKPNWARDPDSTYECNNDWQVATDPDNEHGQGCTAYFDHARVWVERYSPDPYRECEAMEVQPILKGIAVVGGGNGVFYTNYMDRDQVEAKLGKAWIDCVEETQRRLEAAE